MNKNFFNGLFSVYKDSLVALTKVFEQNDADNDIQLQRLKSEVDDPVSGNIAAQTDKLRAICGLTRMYCELVFGYQCQHVPGFLTFMELVLTMDGLIRIDML